MGDLPVGSAALCHIPRCRLGRRKDLPRGNTHARQETQHQGAAALDAIQMTEHYRMAKRHILRHITIFNAKKFAI